MGGVGPIELSQNALTVLQRRYLHRDPQGRLMETPEGMFRRVAKCIANVDREYGDRDAEAEEEEFYAAMTSLAFLPNSPTLMNAGTQIASVGRLFRAAGGGFHRGHFRCGEMGGDGASERWRHGIFLLQTETFGG